MPGWLTWLLAMGALIMESALLAALGVDSWSLQTAVALTMFLALRREFVTGALILAGLLVPIEWLVGGPPGYYSLSLVAVYFLLRLARGSIESEWGFSQAVLALFTVGVQTGVMVLALLLFHPNARLIYALLWGAIPGAIGAAAVAWPLGALFTRLDRALDPRNGRGIMGLS